MSDDRKDLPPTSSSNFLDRVREVIQTYLGRQGDVLDRGLTLRDVQAIDLATVRPGFVATRTGTVLGDIGSAVAAAYEADLTPPPTPTGLAVSAGISKLVITWDTPTFLQGHGYDRAIIYGATYSGTGPLPTFASAVELIEAQGSVVAYATQPATEWHIWIKWKSVDGVLSSSPAGGTNGVSATTGQDVTLLLNALTAAASNPAAPYAKYAVRADLFYVESSTGPTDASLFTVVSSPITVNGVSVPVGVYMNDAFIENGTIVNAKIGNAAIDNAKIANLAVDNAKIANATITGGKITASTITGGNIAAATITGGNIAAGTITASNITANTITTDRLIANAATAATASTLDSGEVTFSGSSSSMDLPASGTPLTLTTTGAPVKVLVSTQVTGFYNNTTAPDVMSMQAQLFVDGVGHETWTEQIKPVRILPGAHNGWQGTASIPIVYRDTGLTAGSHSFYVHMLLTATDAAGSTLSFPASSFMRCITSLLVEENKV